MKTKSPFEYFWIVLKLGFFSCNNRRRMCSWQWALLVKLYWMQVLHNYRSDKLFHPPTRQLKRKKDFSTYDQLWDLPLLWAGLNKLGRKEYICQWMSTKSTLFISSYRFSFKYCSQEKKQILGDYPIERLFRLKYHFVLLIDSENSSLKAPKYPSISCYFSACSSDAKVKLKCGLRCG